MSEYEFDQMFAEAIVRIGLDPVARYLTAAARSPIITGSSAARCTRGSALLRNWVTAMLWGCSRGGCTRISGIADD